MKKVVYDPDSDLFDEILFDERAKNYTVLCPDCGEALLVITTKEAAKETGFQYGLYCRNTACNYNVVFNMIL